MHSVVLAFLCTIGIAAANPVCAIHPFKDSVMFSNQCIQFSVGGGTGCAWMCNYCSEQLGTDNYYFTDGVCTYQEGTGCVGNPVAGKTYTCCAV